METKTATFGVGASKVFTSQKRYTIAVAGQRGGKTTVGSYWAYNQMTQMRVEHTVRGDTLTAPWGMIVAPTYDLLRNATLNRFFEEFPMLKRYYKEQKREMNIPIFKENGKVYYSKVFTRSLDDPEMIVGLMSWWFWADEGDRAKSTSWEILKGRIADHADGKGLVTSTLSRNSWIYPLVYQPLQTGKVKDVDIITWASNDRPGFPKSEWDTLKKTMDPVQFARDFEGKFVFEQGLVYGDILKYGVIDEVPSTVKIKAIFFSIDYGLRDKTVVMVVGYGSDSSYYILDETVSPAMSVDQINTVLSNYIQLYTPLWATYYDPAGGIAALSLLNDCMPIAASKDVDSRITLIRNLIYQKRLYVLSKNYDCIKEFSSYSFSPHSNRPVDGNDHSMNAMEYAIFSSWDSVSTIQPEANRPILTPVAEYYRKRGWLQNGEDDYILEETSNLII